MEKTKNLYIKVMKYSFSDDGKQWQKGEINDENYLTANLLINICRHGSIYQYNDIYFMSNYDTSRNDICRIDYDNYMREMPYFYLYEIVEKKRYSLEHHIITVSENKIIARKAGDHISVNDVAETFPNKEDLYTMPYTNKNITLLDYDCNFIKMVLPRFIPDNHCYRCYIVITNENKYRFFQIHQVHDDNIGIF